MMLDSISNAPKRLAYLQSLVSNFDTGDGQRKASAVNEIAQSLRTDTSDIVRHEAAFLLGQLQMENKLPSPIEVFGALITALKTDRSILVAHEVALSLAHFPCEEAVEELLVASKKWAAPEITSSAQYSLVDMLNRRVS